MLPLEVFEKLSEDMNIAFKEAKAVELMAQYLPEGEHHAALIATIQETAAIVQRTQEGLITLLLSVMAHGVGSNHKLDAA